MLAEARRDLEETRNFLHHETESQRAKIMQVDSSIEATSRQLQVLKHYKDKEFPVRQVKIEQLKESEEDLNVYQMREKNELELQITEEREHYEHHLLAIKEQLRARATEV